MGQLAVMGVDGDTTKITWDPEYQEEVDNARCTFEDLSKKGYLAFRVTGDGTGCGGVIEQILTFDEHAEELILRPANESEFLKLANETILPG